MSFSGLLVRHADDWLSDKKGLKLGGESIKIISHFLRYKSIFSLDWSNQVWFTKGRIRAAPWKKIMA